MRFAELFENDYTDDIQSEIITLLATVSATGVKEVKTSNLLKDLLNMGYSVDEDTLLEILDDLDIVATANKDDISISTSDMSAFDMAIGSDSPDPDRVGRLAKKQASDSLRNKPSPKFKPNKIK